MGTHLGAATNRGVNDPRFSVLVEEGVMNWKGTFSRKGLLACARAFSNAATSLTDAVQTIKDLRNILSHLNGSLDGLPELSFNVIVELISEAMHTVAAELGPEHTKRLEVQLAKRKAEASPTRSRSSSPESADSTPDDGSISVCSTPSAHEDKDWASSVGEEYV